MYSYNVCMCVHTYMSVTLRNVHPVTCKHYSIHDCKTGLKMCYLLCAVAPRTDTKFVVQIVSGLVCGNILLVTKMHSMLYSIVFSSLSDLLHWRILLCYCSPTCSGWQEQMQVLWGNDFSTHTQEDQQGCSKDRGKQQSSLLYFCGVSKVRMSFDSEEQLHVLGVVYSCLQLYHHSYNTIIYLV